MTTTPTVDSVIAGMSLQEKAALLSGADFWHTEPVERHGVPSIMLTDGPHGLRKQPDSGDHLGIGDSVPATCFPPAVGLGCAWDVELVARVGAALADEAAVENLASPMPRSSRRSGQGRSMSGTSTSLRAGCST
ncbi:hypothetical protein BH09ACT8_BH09ACT8_65080 [soil metagenome]